MRFNGLNWSLLLAVSISTALGADSEKSKFEVKPAAAYPHHQTSEKITIAAEPMETDEQTHEAFGKVNPYRYGVLPVLLVIQNDGTDAIKVDRMKLVYSLPDGTRIEATPAQDVRFIHGTQAPNRLPGLAGGTVIKKNPEKPSCRVGNRRQGVCGKDGSRRSVRQRICVLPGPTEQRSRLRLCVRSGRSGERQRALLLRNPHVREVIPLRVRLFRPLGTSVKG